MPHFEKLLRLFGIKVLKTSLYTSSAGKNQAHPSGLLNALWLKKIMGFFFLCVIPSKATIAFLVASILEESCRTQILEDVDSEVIPSS